MSNVIIGAVCLVQTLQFLTCSICCAQDNYKNPVRFMFYNVENLFDVVDDTLKNDDEFLPEGTMRWNYSRYDKKITSLYKTIVAAGEWSPPEVIAFSEIENRDVLEDLIYGTYLSKFNYRILHEDSPDPRGIDVCLIYRANRVSVIKFEYWIPSDLSRSEFKTRNILYAKLAVNSDTLHLLINHWPSRRGGVLAGEDLRMKIASMVRSKADSLNLLSGSKAKVIIMGDFNCTPDDEAMQLLSGNKKESIILVNLSEAIDSGGQGTYRYKGTWEMIDQVVVSEELLTCKSGAFSDFGSIKIFRPGFLLGRDPDYPGFMPLSTYRGYRYYGGTSDHLPVLLNIYFRNYSLEK